VESDDADVFGYHYENQMLAVNLFHMRGGKVVDRREFFWEDLPRFEANRVGTVASAGVPGEPGSGSTGWSAVPAEPSEAVPASDTFAPGEFFSTLLKQLYIGQPYVPRNIYVPVDFEDRETLEELLSEQVAGEAARPARAHIVVPQRGEKRSLIDLAGNNAKQSYDQRFRVM